jgi:hypothetical protein
MTANNPPSIISSIYNPSFFETLSTEGLTQSQANGLYLQKTVADTATALETFSAGITISGSNNITLGNGTVSPSSAQLGFVSVGSNVLSTTNIPINGTTTDISSMTLQAGTWLISVNASLTVGTTLNITDVNGYRFNISTVSSTFQTTTMVLGTQALTFYTSATNVPSLSGFCIVSPTTSTTYYLCANLIANSGTATAGSYTKLRASRIA